MSDKPSGDATTPETSQDLTIFVQNLLEQMVSGKQYMLFVFNQI
jgi:hypothetical protein